MENSYKSHTDFKTEALVDPELREEYDQLEEEYSLLRQLILEKKE